MIIINENLFLAVVSIIAIVAIVCLTFYGGAFAEEAQKVLLVDDEGNVIGFGSGCQKDSKGRCIPREGGRTVGAGVVSKIIE